MLQSKEQEYPSTAPAYYCILPHFTDNTAAKGAACSFGCGIISRNLQYAGVPLSSICLLLLTAANCSFLLILLQSKEQEYPPAPAYYCIMHTAAFY